MQMICDMVQMHAAVCSLCAHVKVKNENNTLILDNLQKIIEEDFSYIQSALKFNVQSVQNI